MSRRFGRPQMVDSKKATCLNCDAPLFISFPSYGPNYATATCTNCGTRIHWPSKNAYLARPQNSQKGVSPPEGAKNPPAPSPKPVSAPEPRPPREPSDVVKVRY